MIDLHSHFLPGIDDGAQTMADALILARAAVDNGITYCMMTPHMHPGRFDNKRSTIEPVFNALKKKVRDAGIALMIGMAAEVRLAPEILTMLRDNEIPFLGEYGGYKIMLLEFPHDHLPPGAGKLVEHLMKQNVRPLIAHPERNKDILRDVSKIQPFIEMGCWLQITAGAVVGDFGKGPCQRARQLLELGAFTILASDSHNLSGRRPKLREGMEAAARMIGASAASDLVYKNPLAIIRSEMAQVA